MKNLNFELIKPILEASKVEFAAVFGSYARDEQKVDSDVDILVRFKEVPGFIGFGRLERQLSEVLGKKIDLVTANMLSPYFRDDVLQYMKSIYGQR